MVNLLEIDKLSVGERIHDIRITNGLTMEEFGARLKTSKASVNNWEKGVNLPNKQRLKQIADMGSISVNYLLYGVQDLQGNQMTVHELSFYEYEILDATIRKPVVEDELILLFDLIKLTKGNDTLGCIVRSTCAFDDGKLSVVYFEDCSGRYDSDFFTKKIPKGIAMDKIKDLNIYLTQRKYIAGFDDFTKKFYDEFKKHIIDYVSTYTDTTLNDNEISFRFVNNWNKVYKV